MYLILGLLFLISFFSFFSLAPWFPTFKKDLKRINDILNLKQGESFLEVGCGTSRVSIFLAKNNLNSNIVGIELSPLFFIISRLKVFFLGLKNIKIIYGNILKIDLSHFDAIYLFGMPETNIKLFFPKIKNIKNKNFRLVMYCFNMNNNIFKEIKHTQKNNNISIYEYRIK